MKQMNLLEAKQELAAHGLTMIKEGLFGYDADKVKNKVEQVIDLCKTDTEHFKASSDGNAIIPLSTLHFGLKLLLKALEKGDDTNWHIKSFLKDSDYHYATLYCKDDSYVDELRKAWHAEKIDDEKFSDEKGKTKTIKLNRFRKEIGGELENVGITPLYNKIKTADVGDKLKDEYDFKVVIPLDVSKLFKD